MAKSLRAKSHLNAKSIKRTAVFQKVVDERAARLAQKLKDNLLKQKEEQAKSGEAPMKMEVEQEAKKISTAGWRDARHLNYRRAKKARKNNKKGSFTKF
ncbi:HBL184Wp [Eremothecium sinecaudum]|uniref:HBL184Wp n=1 Tax=Eremothecium sinecaudum TaxID=45286 RepID=A0A109UW94_9SACH|nr:HBL184Wp [Eremothecium sinecaudum]AMD18718.1 HBL184Wp [Eremothecium sinecaudum]